MSATAAEEAVVAEAEVGVAEAEVEEVVVVAGAYLVLGIPTAGILMPNAD